MSTTMKRSMFEVNHVDKKIVGSKTVLKKAGMRGTPEYNELVKLIADFPHYAVSGKGIRNNPSKKTYGGLTFDRMKEYIETQYSDDELKKALLKFEAVKRVAEAKGAKYPLTKKWFLKTYTNYKGDVSDAEEVKTFEKKKAEAELEAAKELEGLID